MNHEAYVQLELLQQQLTELESVMQQAASQIDHANIALQTLEALKSASPGQELLVPLGSGIFLPVQVKDVQKLRVAVGAGVVVEKSPEQAKNSIEKQTVSLQQHQQQSAKLYEQIIEKIHLVQEEIEKSQGQE